MKTQKRLKSIILYTVTLMVCSIFMFPFLVMIMTSLKPYKETITLPITVFPRNITASAYFQIQEYIPFFRYAWNTFILVFFNVIATVITCPLVAYSFARLQWKGRETLFFITVAVMIIPAQVTLVPMFLLYSSFNLANGSIIPLILPQFFGTPFYIFLMRQFFKSMPKELENAARIDGCGAFSTYIRIFLPLSTPGILSLTIYQFVATWNDFTGPLIYLTDNTKWTLQLGLNMFKRARGTMWPPLMATAALMCIPAFLLFAFAQRYFIDSITFSGIKG